MSTIINGTSSAITFPDTTVQNTAFTTGAVTQSTIATGVAGTGPAFSAYQSSGQSISANTFTKVTLDSEIFDTNSNFASSRFTPTVAGYYQINASVSTTTNLGSTIYFNAYITKNGTANAQTTAYPAPANYFSAFVATVLYLNGTTDYVELYTQSNSAFTTQAGTSNTILNGCLVRAA